MDRIRDVRYFRPSDPKFQFSAILRPSVPRFVFLPLGVEDGTEKTTHELLLFCTVYSPLRNCAEGRSTVVVHYPFTVAFESVVLRQVC